MRIGPYLLPNNVFVAPMAGVTDRPYRQLCKSLGAGHAISEMAASNPRLWASEKTMRRLNHAGERAPVAVQLAGSDPAMLAEAARFNATAARRSSISARVVRRRRSVRRLRVGAAARCRLVERIRCRRVGGRCR
jgi:hypothetical protein